MNNASSPGVGKYEAASSFGKQNESKTKNIPSFSFSHSNRDQRAKVCASFLNANENPLQKLIERINILEVMNLSSLV